MVKLLKFVFLVSILKFSIQHCAIGQAFIDIDSTMISNSAPSLNIVDEKTKRKKFKLKEGKKVWLLSYVDKAGKDKLQRAKITKIEGHQITFTTLGEVNYEIEQADSVLDFIAFTSFGRVFIATTSNTLIKSTAIAGFVAVIGVVVLEVTVLVLYPIIAIFSRSPSLNFDPDFSWVGSAFKAFGNLFTVNVPFKKKVYFDNCKCRLIALDY